MTAYDPPNADDPDWFGLLCSPLECCLQCEERRRFLITGIYWLPCLVLSSATPSRNLPSDTIDLKAEP